MIENTTVEKQLTQHTKITNDLSQEVFDLTYKFGNESIDNAFYRVAKSLASVEEDSDYWTEKFYEALTDFKFVPGGRILSNAGTELTGTTMINCFVDGFVDEDRDSMEGILSALRRQALILKSEGGYGFCADTMRPRGGFITGIANESPGAVKMLEMWDKQSDVITAGSGKKSSKAKAKGKIRKGAQMVTMSIWHPDIEEFITAKRNKGTLEKFNMSALITDEFMDAVENEQPWDLIFPDYELDMETYKKEWNGNIKEWKAKGYPIRTYKTLENANTLWDLIMQSTYNRNEPGVLFVDTINRMNNLYYNEYISATNPCLTGDTIVKAALLDIDLNKLVEYYPNINFDIVLQSNYISIDIDLKTLVDIYKNNKNSAPILVLSYNEDTKTNEWKEVKWGDMTRSNAEIIELELEDGSTIKLTPDHKVFTSNRGWIEAQNLNVEDELISIEEKLVQV